MLSLGIEVMMSTMTNYKTMAIVIRWAAGADGIEQINVQFLNRILIPSDFAFHYSVCASF